MRSLLAVLAGLVVVVVLTALTDGTLQAVGVLPATGQRRFEDGEAALALSYHLLYVTAGAYLCARLAPRWPLGHALAFGAVGLGMSLLGLQAILTGDLAPAWYGWALIVLALPVSGFGGHLAARRRRAAR
jgi:hypothetical protein